MRSVAGVLGIALAALLAACAPCKTDQDCGSAGLCVKGECHDFSNDNIPCSCASDADCHYDGLSCVMSRCETNLGTPAMCH